jgi:hypothetical protein
VILNPSQIAGINKAAATDRRHERQSCRIVWRKEKRIGVVFAG